MGASKRIDDFAWDKFFWRAWASDQGLKLSSYAAKGLWMDMLCTAWEANPRGVLPGNLDMLAKLLGSDRRKIRPLIEELGANEVFSRGGDVHPRLAKDAIVCRRMFRKFHLSELRAEAGRKGAEAKAKQKKQVQGEWFEGDGPDEEEANGWQRSDLIRIEKEEERNTNTEIRARGRVGGPTRIGDVLRQAALPSSDRGAILERIAAITGDGPEWAEWFRVVAAKLEWADALHVLRDLVKKVEDSRDPVAARNKGEGCIQHPGRFISSEVMRWAREHRVKLPEAPE